MPQESSSELDPDDSDTEFAEVDPSGRYGRYKEVLGKGAFKKVYRAFDEWEGIEVAWNQVKVADLLRNSEELERLYSEVHLLKTLKHKNIIKFYNSWVDTKNEHINFITEIFTSGTLRQYRKKHKKVDLRAVKKWSRQILEGLLYLHSHDPPVIHRDLKCDNIFVNGNQGEVKIGDLGLAAILQQARSAHSVIGTPEFMAPELYEEEYNELVDIYAFGMCLLELVTLEYPYVECANAAQIFKKVTSGIKPASLGKVKDPGVKAFIEKCIAKVSDRVPAKELLMDPFLQSDEDICGTSRSLHSNLNNSEGNIDHIDGDITPKDSMFEGTLDFTVQGQRKDLNTIFLKLRIADPAGHIRNIHFPFDIECDTATAVAGEMVQELDLTDQDVSMIASMINAEIRSYIPDWTPRESPHEHNGSEATISEGCASDVQDDISPLSHDSFPSANLKLERLPSGKVYWSNSPKSGGGSSPLRVGPSNLSRTDSETPRDSDTEEDEHSPHNPSDEDNTRQAAVLELLKDECTLHNNAKEIEATLPTDSGVSEVDSANDPPVSNGLDPSEGNSNKVNRSCSDDVIVIVQKLEHLLSEQQIELDELKRKHALAVSNFLTELPPEISSKIFQNCSLRISDYKIHYKSCISPEKDTDKGSLKIKLENMHIGGKGGKHESVAGKRVFSPVFGSISNALKKKTQGGAGIAVIL